jgi:FlaG/FlaF family flagellin (archaellin)
LYHHASADSTFASTTIDAATASFAATDPSDKLTPDELTILSSDGGEFLNEIMSVGGNSLRGIYDCSLWKSVQQHHKMLL